MRRMAALLLGLALLALPAQAQAPVSASDQAGIRDVITRQIEAFRRDDAAGAYAFATPELQGMFGTAENFLSMVRRSYMPVYRPRDVEFSELSRHDGLLTQQVEIVGPDGGTVLAVYTMEPDGHGGWRISGCYLTPSVRVGT